MGCHIYSPPYRALKLTSPSSVMAVGPAPSAESWAVKARVKVTYPGTEFTAGRHGGRVVVRRRRAAARCDSRAGRHPLPAQGSVVVGTTGMLVLPHGSDPAFVRRTRGHRCRPSRLPDRDHYSEFIDVVLGGSRTKCSANLDYAGPLTEAVLIGNVAAHFPGETLEFDGKSLSFPKRKEANGYLTRSYRKGWEIKG